MLCFAPGHIRCWYRVWYPKGMGAARKITIEVPVDLLQKAQQATGAGITQTVRTGLELVAASRTYARLRQLRGKVRFSRTLADLKADR
jgi:hypothetical protein